MTKLNLAIITPLLLCCLVTKLNGQEIKSLPLKTYSIVYSEASDRIYASMRNDTHYGDSICVINPYFGTVERCLGFGGAIRELAITPAGDKLYLGFDQEPKVLRYNLLQETIEVEIDLGNNYRDKPFTAQDIEILPGSPNSFAMIVRAENNQYMAIYDNDQRRPAIFDSDIFGNPNIDEIVFTDNPLSMYGKDHGTSSDIIYTFYIDESGFDTENYLQQDNLSFGFRIAMEYHDGFIYHSSGLKLKPTDDGLQLVGRFDVGDPYDFNSFEVAENRDEIFVLAKSTLKIIDKNSFRQLKSIFVPYAYNDISFVSAGDSIFVFNAYSSQSDYGLVGILRYCTPQNADRPDLTAPSVAPCQNDTLTLTVESGPGPFFWSNGEVGSEINVSRAGIYSYQVADDEGCLGEPSNEVELSFDPQPVAPTIDVSSNNIAICLDQTLTLGIKNFNPSRSYLWSTNERTQNIIVEAEDTITLQVLSPNGCASPESEPVVVKQSTQLPPAPPNIEPVTASVLCNYTPIDLSAVSNIVNPEFFWSTGDTTSEITVDFPRLYSVRVKDQEGCLSPSSKTIFIPNQNRPSQPTLQLYNGILASSAGNGNQWYKDGEVLGGETGQFLRVNTPGQYSVQVDIKGCKSPVSEVIEVQ